MDESKQRELAAVVDAVLCNAENWNHFVESEIWESQWTFGINTFQISIFHIIIKLYFIVSCAIICEMSKREKMLNIKLIKKKNFLKKSQF